MQNPEKVVWASRGDVSLQSLRDTLQKYRRASETDSEAKRAVFAEHFPEHADIITQTISIASELRTSVVPTEAVQKLAEASNRLVEPLRLASGEIARARAEYTAILKFQPFFELSAAVDAFWEAAADADAHVPPPVGFSGIPLAEEVLDITERAGDMAVEAVDALRRRLRTAASPAAPGHNGSEEPRYDSSRRLTASIALSEARSHRLTALSKATAGLAKIQSSTYTTDSQLPDEVAALIGKLKGQRDDFCSLLRKNSSSLSQEQLLCLLQPGCVEAKPFNQLSAAGDASQPADSTLEPVPLQDALLSFVEAVQISAQKNEGSSVSSILNNLSPFAALVLEAKTRCLFSRKLELFSGMTSQEFCELITPCFSDALPSMELSALGALEWDKRMQVARSIYPEQDEDMLLQELARLLLIVARAFARFRCQLLVVSSLARYGGFCDENGDGDCEDDALTQSLSKPPGEVWPGLDWAGLLSGATSPGEDGPYAVGVIPDGKQRFPLSFSPIQPSEPPVLALLCMESRFAPEVQHMLMALVQNYLQTLDYAIAGIGFLWRTFGGELEMALARSLCKEVIELVIGGALQFFFDRSGTPLAYSRAQQAAFSAITRWISALTGLRPSPVEADLIALRTSLEATILESVMDSAAVVARGVTWMYSLVPRVSDPGGSPLDPVPSPFGRVRPGTVVDNQASRDFLAGILLRLELDRRVTGTRSIAVPFSPDRDHLLAEGVPSERDLVGAVLWNLDMLVRHVLTLVNSWDLADPASLALKKQSLLRLQWCYVDIVHVIISGNYRGTISDALNSFPEYDIVDLYEGKWDIQPCVESVGQRGYIPAAQFLASLLRDLQLFSSSFHPFFLTIGLPWLGYSGFPRLPPNLQPVDSMFPQIYDVKTLSKLTGDGALRQILGPDAYTTYSESVRLTNELTSWIADNPETLDSIPGLQALESAIQSLLDDVAALIGMFDFDSVMTKLDEHVLLLSGRCARPEETGLVISGVEFSELKDVQVALGALLLELLREDSQVSLPARLTKVFSASPQVLVLDAAREVAEAVKVKGPIVSLLYPELAASLSPASRSLFLPPQLVSRLRAVLLPHVELAQIIDEYVRASALLTAHVTDRERRSIVFSRVQKGIRGLLNSQLEFHAAKSLNSLILMRTVLYVSVVLCLVAGCEKPEGLELWHFCANGDEPLAFTEVVSPRILECALWECAVVHCGPLSALAEDRGQEVN